MKTNTKLIDLGSYPGGWSQVANQIITTGKILSIDIKEMEPIKNVKFCRGDIVMKESFSAINYFNSKLDVDYV